MKVFAPNGCGSRMDGGLPVPEEIEQEETEVAEIQNHSRLCSLCLLL